MGSPPGTGCANLDFGTSELDLTTHFQERLPFWKCCVDDGIGIWKHHPDPDIDLQQWDHFAQLINNYGLLKWEISTRTKRVNYMDLTITLHATTIHTTLYEKTMNLYLYLPPHTAHPPGVIKGMIYGMFYRFFRLCSDHDDAILAIKQLYRRLRRRGHTKDYMQPIFKDAYKRCFKNREPRDMQNNNHVFLHLTYNKHDIPRRIIQQHFRDTMLHPPGEPPLPSLRNDAYSEIDINRLIVACRRPCNIKNILSPRILRDDLATLADTVAATL